MHVLKTSTTILVGGLLIATLFSYAILSASKVSADNGVVVNVALDVPAACSLTLPNGTNNTETVSSIINPGTRSTIGSSSIKAVCNDPNGLAVYAVGYSGSTYGNTSLIDTTDSTNTISTNYTASGTPSASEWYMSLSAVSGTYAPTISDGTGGTENFTTNHVIPSTYTKVAYRNSNTDVDGDGLTATGANFTATFGTYVTTSQSSGTYEGKVKFLLVHPSTADTPITPVAVPHQICYYGNGEDEGSMACQTTIDINNTALSANAEAQLRASNFSRAGFGFTGWNTKEDGSGIQYGPMETITFTQDMYDNGLMLFANWQAAETGVTMQTFNGNASPYSTMANGSVIALKDTRDNDTYAVAKLADGKWWMIENLRLDYNANITTSNTQSNNGAWGGVFVGLASPETENFSYSTTTNSLYDTTIITGSYQSYRFPRYNNDNTANRQTDATGSGSTYSYGNYYTWSAAIVDTTAYYANNQSVTSTSLCPSGWHLPKGGNKNNEANSEYWNLTHAIVGENPANYYWDTSQFYTGDPEGINASKAMRAYPNNFVYSGYYNGSSASNRGSGGGYWSSTASGSSDAYYQYLYNNGVDPGTSSYYKYYGRSVRCLAD